jgi:hypothetical protein
MTMLTMDDNANDNAATQKNGGNADDDNAAADVDTATKTTNDKVREQPAGKVAPEAMAQ